VGLLLLSFVLLSQLVDVVKDAYFLLGQEFDPVLLGRRSCTFILVLHPR
jgi:hypothetical protein